MSNFTTSKTASEVEPFPDTTIIKVVLRRPARMKKLGLSLQEVKKMINFYIKSPLMSYIRNTWIFKKIPVDTGKLRRSILRSLERANSSLNAFSANTPFSVMLNTQGVPYAWFTTRMPEAWIQGEKDPNAVHNWWNRMINNSRSKTKLMVRNFFNKGIAPLLRPLQKLGTISSASAEARGLFRITDK